MRIKAIEIAILEARQRRNILTQEIGYAADRQEPDAVLEYLMMRRTNMVNTLSKLQGELRNLEGK